MSEKVSNNNPFCQSKGGKRYREKLQKAFFCFATYFVLLCASVIFGKIIYEGTPVLWRMGTDFLTQKPQTLAVVEAIESDSIEIPTENFDNILRSNDDDALPIDNVEEFEKSFPYKRFNLMPGSIIGEGYLKNLEQQNEGFFLIYTERDTESHVGFSIDQEKSLTLKSPDFEKLKSLTPDLIPEKITQRHITLNDFKLTIAQGDYNISKTAHDALLPTSLVFQMREGFADDDPESSQKPAIIPSTQIITVDSNVFFTAFDEDEEGTLALQAQEELPQKTTFYDFKLAAGNYSAPLAALSILAKTGIATQHNLTRGSIIVNLDEPVELELSSSDYENLVANNPKLQLSAIADFAKKADFTRFSLAQDAEIRIDSEDLEALNQANEKSGNFKTNSKNTHSYAGGGILGPIVGTALLVIICMIIALFTGIAAATFLNEYARKGAFTKSIRLAMLNLAGVPSIVFGLFGLGLFVMLAPSLTSTPHTESKLSIPLVPLASTPQLRIIEEKEIHMVKHKVSTSEAIVAAKSESMKYFHDGWTYLSFQGWGTCMLAGGFTLAIMVLPVIITSCEESLRAVPMGFREASLALGATKWQSIRTAVLPYALPGILTASVLGITRVAGETAPIMFTAAAAERSDMPWEAVQATGFSAFIEFLQQSVQALPYHIYTVAGRIPQSEYTEPMQYGSVLVFMLIVMSLATVSIWLRLHFRKKIKW